MRFALELFGAAFLASVFGSMVGLGGGFILVPILRLFLGFSPAYAAGTSLVLIVANSASGALTYLLQRRVHLKIGLLIAAGGLPGSILGAIASFHISARLFDTILAVLLVAVAIDMAWNAQRRMAGRPEHERGTSIKGMSYRAALGLGFIVGIFSSLFGLGGGIVLVPSFLYFSELPAHSISATSHFAILLTSPIGLVVHILQRDIVGRDILPLVAGGLLGGPIGARLSLRLKSPQLLIVVAIALVTAAVSLIWRQL
ncbi:MAG TPA: sulfite exporter TauE/SafE family protein [Candidatus Acidoferrales bacterium]|nr:sulfite exporter TauE/SafE family protein [Candidatus Acidoferrales bacterium]